MNEEKIPIDYVEPEAQPVDASPANSYEISRVRTYKGDINETVKGDKITTAKILIAEQRRDEKEQAKTDTYSIENNTNKFKLILSVTLIGLAVVAIIYVSINFLIPKSSNNSAPIVQNSNRIFVVDKTEYFDTTEKKKEDFQNAINQFSNMNFAENSVNQLIFYQNSIVDSKKVSQILPTASFLRMLDIKTPDLLARSISNNYMFAVYRMNSKNSKFLLFKLADFPNAYNSIFGYEFDLIKDIRTVFGGFSEYDTLNDLRKRRIELLPNEGFVNASSTNSTTTNTEELKSVEIEIARLENVISGYRNFIDMVLQNTDSRTVVSQYDGRILFYYTFIDNQWLLMADDIEVLKEVKRRIREKNLIR